MAWSQEPGSEHLYAAIRQFIERGLRRDDSVFTPGAAIWTAENLADLRRRFIDRPDESSDTFLEKLKRQLAGAPSATVQLAAEVAYINALTPRDIGAPAKLNVVETILSWLPSPPTLPDDLREALDGGFASGGIAFGTHRPFQLWFLIRLAEAFKVASVDERNRVLEDPWAFKDMTEAVPMERAQSQREALLHIVHPQVFETTLSGVYKRQIVDAFAELAPADEGDVDRALLAIREAMTPEYGENFSFYEDPVVGRWLGSSAPAEEPAWTELLTYMAKVFGADDFDDTERAYKLVIAANLKRALEAAARGDDGWGDLLKAGLGAPNNLTDWRANAALASWATAEGTSADARRVFGEFLDPATTPERRFRAFNDSFGAATGANAGMIVALGSLLDFAAEPESMPFVRVTVFERIEKAVDAPTAQADPAPERYMNHVGFAQEVAGRLRTADVPVRDMVDVQSLIYMAANRSTAISDQFRAFLESWPAASKEPFTGHPIRGQLSALTDALSDAAGEVGSSLVSKSSIGAGNWASVPWIAFFDERETRSAQGGVYPVYLFRSDGTGVYLTLDQGGTDIVNEIGRSAAHEELERRVEALTASVRDQLPSFAIDAKPDLRAGTNLGADYEAGVVASKLYDLDELPDDEVIVSDLKEMLEAYSMLIDERSTPGQAPVAEGASISEIAALTYTSERELHQLVDLMTERGKQQVIFEGPPGSGKTYVADLIGRYLSGNPARGRPNDRFVTVQFHQSYGYEDFVQGIRPETDDRGSVRYELRDGVFKALCQRATADPGHRYVVLIDEINRGNISRILGELLLVLEYRDRAVHLSYSAPDAEPFAVPPNVFILGTMNTTDRSLSQIDYALRRRFFFYRLMPTRDGGAPVLRGWLRSKVADAEARARVLRLFIALNQKVSAELDEHFQVGHSYFMTDGIEQEAVMAQTWRYSVMPLLEEYFYNRPNRQELLRGFRRSLLDSAMEPDEGDGQPR